VGFLEVGHLSHALPDGRELLSDVSFRVEEGSITALVGANGTGKTTLLRLIAGDLPVQTGTVAAQGGVGVMRQFIGSVRDDSAVRDLLLSLAPERVRAAAAEVDSAELRMMEAEDEPAQLRYASALAEYADAGGYDTEVLWDACTIAALAQPYETAKWRPLTQLSGGEQKRLALEALLRGPDEVLLLDEPDNYLDVRGKTWLEEQLAGTRKTVLFVSHDRELLARTATRVVTLEGRDTWVHGGRFATWAAARAKRHDRMGELLRRWEEEHERLRQLVFTLRQQAAISPDMASRYRAMQTRLAKYEQAGPPPPPPREDNVTMRLRGGRTGVRAITCERLAITGLIDAFDLEVFYGERLALLGANGSGKSHLLRLLGGGNVAHSGSWRLGGRVIAGLFAQTHDHPELIGRTLVDVLHHGDGGRGGLDRGKAMAALRRYALHEAGDQPFDALSGGQQARFQVLLLELGGATLLLLDEPTDNLDLASAEALQEGLEAFDGTVVAVTHDRWFARSFDRYVLVGADGGLHETSEPVWDEARPVRARASSGRELGRLPRL
jgi:ATPase subunit of ABC transporter with duplicated ATPase domains